MYIENILTNHLVTNFEIGLHLPKLLSDMKRHVFWVTVYILHYVLLCLKYKMPCMYC